MACTILKHIDRLQGIQVVMSCTTSLDAISLFESKDNYLLTRSTGTNRNIVKKQLRKRNYNELDTEELQLLTVGHNSLNSEHRILIVIIVLI